MIVKKQCPFCQGSGVKLVQVSSFLGLIRRELPTTCDNCGGSGQLVEMPTCKVCEGQGLVGNERELCRVCNGTGRADNFAFIPRAKLQPGLMFERRCDDCGAMSFEIVSPLEERKLVKSWEREEELRQVEIVEQVKVRCVACGNSYYIPIDKEWHQELSGDEIGLLENVGVNLSFMYQRG
jgi:hypothetical protein